MSGVSKVIFGTETLIDLTEDTVTPAVLFKGDTAHAANGDKIVGTYEAPSAGTMIEKTVTEDGTYKASDDNAVGYSKVIVQKPFNTGEITITEDGIYKAAGEGYKGYTKVIVKVPGGGGDAYVTTIDDVVQERDLDFVSMSFEEISLPYDFYQGSAVILNGEIHILGGYDSTEEGNCKNHYKYDGGSWVRVSTLPYAFIRGSAVVYNDEIHILGGWGWYDSNAPKKHYKWNGTSWTPVSTLPFDLISGAALMYKGELNILGSTYHYKLNGTDWVSVSTMSYDISEGSVVVYNNEIHTLSQTRHYKYDGYYWYGVSTLPYTFYRGSAIVDKDNVLHIIGGYNTYTAHYTWDGTSWNEDIDLLIPYYFCYGCSLLYNNNIHLLGTNVSGSRSKHYKQSQTNLRKWDSVSTIPYKFYDGAAVVYNGEIHILGGDEPGERDNHYKLNGINWNSVSTLPLDTDNCQAVVCDNRICIFSTSVSGAGAHSWNGTSWNLDIPPIAYTDPNTHIQYGLHFYGCAVVCNNELYVHGYGYGGSNLHILMKWSVGQTEWTFVQGIPSLCCEYSTAVVLNDEIHIFGTPGSVYKTYHYKWDGTSWVKFSELPYYFERGSAVVYNNEIHIMGGHDPSTSSGCRYHYKWNGSEWTLVSLLPYMFYIGSAVVYDGYIHILGGDDYNSETTSRHYRMTDDFTWEFVPEKATYYTLNQDDE